MKAPFDTVEAFDQIQSGQVALADLGNAALTEDDSPHPIITPDPITMVPEDEVRDLAIRYEMARERLHLDPFRGQHPDSLCRRDPELGRDFYAEPVPQPIIRKHVEDQTKKALKEAEDLTRGMNALDAMMSCMAEERRKAGVIMDSKTMTTFADGKKPFAHQVEDSQIMARERKVLLASEMGTGKTRTALRAAEIIRVGRQVLIYVICPPAVMGHWQREAKACGLRLSAFSWGNIPEPWDDPDLPYILVVDECHYGANATATRTKRMKKWCENAFAIFALSGTPMPNARPKELFPVLNVLGHPIADDLRFYERTYCNGHWVAIGKGAKWSYRNGCLEWTCKKCEEAVSLQIWARTKKGTPIKCPNCGKRYMMPQVFWDNRGRSNVDEFARRLDGWMIRRLKKDCLDLPPKTRKTVEIQPSQEDLDKFNMALRGQLDMLEDRERSGEIQPQDVIQALLHTRLAASVCKIHAAIDMVKQLNEDGHRVAVFAEFVETVKAIAGAFRGKAMVGDVPAAKRTKMIEEFQAGKRLNFMATTKSGGAGVDLTAADYVLMVDRPWNMATVEQAEDRLHRPGQHWPVTSVWLKMFDVDAYVDQVCLGKGRINDLVLKGAAGKAPTETDVAMAIMGALSAKQRAEEPD